MLLARRNQQKINFPTVSKEIGVSLLRKVKKKYFATLSEKDITDNKKFWQTIKLFLSEKTKSREKITLKTKTWFQMMQK